MLGRLILLFVAVPVIELILLLQIGERIGFFPTVGLVLTTGVLGAAMARTQGLKVFAAVQNRMAQGQLPGDALQDGLAVLIGGAFLLTPGVLTDLLGFSLLIPATRGWIKALVRRRLERQIREGTVNIRVMGPDGEFVNRSADLGSWVDASVHDVPPR
ncbi:MAG: FxsA family protein [Longimicrobiales bacterium]